MSLKITNRQIDILTQAQSDMLDEQEYEEACATLRRIPDDAVAKAIVETYKRRGLIVTTVPRQREKVGIWKRHEGVHRIYVCGAEEGDVVPVRTLQGTVTYYTLGKRVASCTYVAAGTDLIRTAEWIAQDRKKKERL